MMNLIKKGMDDLRQNGLGSLIKKLMRFFSVRSLALLIFLFTYIFSSIIERNDNIWVFSDFTSEQNFSQNNRYLYSYLNKERTDEVRPIWITDSSELYEDLSDRGYEVYMASSMKSRYYTLRAKYIPMDSIGRGGLPIYGKKCGLPWSYAGGATIIMMGHGIPLKSNLGGEKRLIYRIVSQNHMDYSVFSSEYCETHFQKFFQSGFEEETKLPFTEGQSIHTGYPRTDVIVNEDAPDISVSTDPVLPSLSDTDLVIGYFPTRRESHGLDMSDLFHVDQTNSFLRKHSAKLLIKPHRSLHINRGIIESDLIQVIHPDTDSHQFLAKIDILITDYSSIYFDFLLLDRPVVFYTPDYSTYEDIRGVHPNFEDVTAGPRADGFEELLESLESTVNGPDKYKDRREMVRNLFFEYKDGNASKRVFEAVTK